MKVKCIAIRTYSHLSIGKKYNVGTSYENYYGITNDNNVEHPYPHSIFEVVQEPDTVEVKLQLPEIEGYEYTGEHRQSVGGECYMINGRAEKMVGGSNCAYPILKKKAPKYKTHKSSIWSCGKYVETEHVEIKALEDALAIIYDLSTNAEDQKVINDLKAAIN